MADIERSGSNTAIIKRIIGVLLLLLGAYVTYDGIVTDDTVAIVAGVASVLGGLAFLLIRPRHVT